MPGQEKLYSIIPFIIGASYAFMTWSNEMVPFSDFCLKGFKANLNFMYNKKISENILALIEIPLVFSFSHVLNTLDKQ